MRPLMSVIGSTRMMLVVTIANKMQMMISRLPMVGILYWFEPGGNCGNGYRQDNGAGARTPLTDDRSNGKESAQRKTSYHGIEHITVGTRWGHDNGDEHAIKGDTQR